MNNEKLLKIKKINMTDIEKALFENLDQNIENYKTNNYYMMNILKIDESLENQKNRTLNFESHLAKIIDCMHEHKINNANEEKLIQEKSFKLNIEY